ncbi:uncharacterized protein N7482_004264 [Penicillium canariense]|uniref:Uncharacterized protein n=1 Tax=Penicillium canariense TaxID=189055 RepID=A0A9W9LQ41_9EURO|nr:uncharacterized protein N7482_004264 [Penicillium canariense]KAJ5168670.1 hypothetical protein N7482_004264 [Penicillium canariense]
MTCHDEATPGMHLLFPNMVPSALVRQRAHMHRVWQARPEQQRHRCRATISKVVASTQTGLSAYLVESHWSHHHHLDPGPALAQELM